MVVPYFLRKRLFFFISIAGMAILSCFIFSHIVKAVGCGGSCAVYGCDGVLSCSPGKLCGKLFNSCSGATCSNGGNWDTSSPCDTVGCTPAGTTRTATWGAYGACSASCGTGTQTRTCNCGAQNNCTVTCSSPTTSCGGTSSQSCCTSVAPAAPTVTAAGNGSCTTNGAVTVNWTAGTSSCGSGWGYACSSASNSFYIVDGATTIASGISSGARSQVITLTAGTHSIKVCANNGLSQTCSPVYSTTISRDTTAPSIPVPTTTLTSDVSCPGKYRLNHSWKAVADSGCAGLSSTPYWSQSSLGSAFPTNLFPLNTWGNYTTQTTNTSYAGGTTLYTHVRSRDALDNQSAWSATQTVVIPSPTLYPTIHVQGSYQEKIIDGGTTSCSDMNVNTANLTLQVNIPPYVTPVCTKTAASYSCNFTIDNQTPANACVSNSVTIGINGTYSGYSNVSWLSGESCSGTSAQSSLNAGNSDTIPLFFTYDASGSEGWFKISNASFTNRLETSRNNFIPYNIQAYDSTDNVSTHNFSIKNAGIVSQQALLNVGANAKDASGNPLYSASNAYTNGYVQINDVDYEKYTQYVKSRKGFSTKALLSDITSNGIYLISSPVTVDAASSALLSGKKVVIIVEGANTITFANDFSPTNASIAFVGPTITINPSVKSITAVLIAGEIQTGESANELKISGNVVSQNAVSLKRKRSSPQRPSFFVDFSIQTYLDLLPYLSVSTYDWKQMQ